MSDDTEPLPCAKYVTEPPEAAHYRLECTLKPGHEGACHAHLWGEDGRCACGQLNDDSESDVGKIFTAQVAPRGRVKARDESGAITDFELTGFGLVSDDSDDYRNN